MERKHHTTFVAAEVLAALERLKRELRVDGINSVVELALAGLAAQPDTDMTAAVYAAVPKSERFAGAEMKRLQLHLPGTVVADITTAAERTPLPKMRIVGVLLAGNLDQLQQLIAAARGAQTDKETDDGSNGERREPPG